MTKTRLLCPLCSCEENSLFDQDKNRTYQLCQYCSLVFVPRDLLLTAQDEKKRYDSHNNSSEDIRYVNYLTKIKDSIEPFIIEAHRGLDFGCGSSQILQELLETLGKEVDSYDLYYLANEDIWQKKYDFIVMSEVIEHLGDPRGTMMNLTKLLGSNGKIFVKTRLYPEDPISFRNWPYKRDRTHIQFFNEKSFRWLAQDLSLSYPEKIGEDLFLFKK